MSDHRRDVAASERNQRSGSRPRAVKPYRQIEEALHRSEQAYRELTEQVPVGIYRSTLEGRFVFVNAAFSTILGYESVDEVLRLDIPTDVYWDNAERDRLIARNEELGGVSAFEVRLRRKDGTPVWVQIDGHAVQDKTGRTLYLEGFARDIDAEKRAERHIVTLSNLGRRLSSTATAQEAARIIAGCADDLWRWDACTVDRYSAELDRVDPLLAVDLVDGRRSDVPPVRVGTSPSPRERRVLKEGPLLITRNGTEAVSVSIPFGDTARSSPSIMIAPIHHGEAVTGFLSVQSYTPKAYDRVDLEALQSLADFCGGSLARIGANDELRKSERLLREAQRAGQIGSWEWDIRRNTVAWSEELCRIFDLQPGVSGVTREDFSEGVFPEDRSRVRGLVERALLDQKPFSCECRIRRPDGEVRVLFARAEPIADPNGTLIRMVGTAHDITERKQAEEELHASRERLVRLSRRLIEAQEAERRRLARELHDEIGQALTALKINLQAVQRPDDDPDVASRLEDSMEIVARTIRQVRDMSLTLRPSLLDDLGLVAALRWLVDSQAQRTGFAAQFEVEPPAIRLSSDLEIGCYRVVQEALTNVARHSRAQNVRVEMGLRNGELRLVIQDDGAGFDLEAARERARHGASLGLLSMTERVRLLGGRLNVQSSPGKGTEVQAVFPAQEAP